MEQRRNYLRITNPVFQLRFLIFNMLTGVCASGLIFFASWYGFKDYRTTLELRERMTSEQFEAVMAQKLIEIYTWLGGVVIINILASLIIGFFVSQSIAGLVLKVTNELKNLAEGKPVDPIKPRKGDVFFELADAFNQLIKKQKDT